MNGNLKIFPLISLVLSLGLFATSCSAAAPSATPTSPAAPAPMTESATPQPSAAATRRPQSTPLFAHTPSESFGGVIPTAIAQPQQPQTSARLKAWTEQDAIALIHEMDQYAHDANVDGLAGSRYVFINSQRAVRFAVQEALDRFPNSQFKDDYLWHLAFSRAVLREPGVDEWLIEHLDLALNQDGYSPDTLNQLLNPYGFNLNDMRVVPNLFDDGKTGWVFNIKTNEPNTSDGLFLAVRQKTTSGYQLFKLASQWIFDFGESSIGKIEDNNKNGIPDVIVYIGTHGGTSCNGTSQIYEWNGTAFYDVSKGVLKQFDCGQAWDYGPNDLNGVPIILVDDFFKHSKDQYTWKGKFYEFTGYFETPSVESCSILPCDQSAALVVLLKTLPADTKDVPTLLQQNGFDLDYSTSFDINADGQLEWLVVGTDYSWNLIALQDGHFQRYEAGSGTEEIPETVQVVHWKGIPDPLLLLRGKESLDVFAINKNFEMNPLVSEWNVKDVSFFENQSAPEIQVTYQDILPADYHIEIPWAGYRWDAESGTFKDDLLEYKLFIEHNPKAAVEIAAQSLPLFDHWTKQLNIPYATAAHNYYLAGLAYELAGDAQKAAQIYWQLWHDYPDSAYALMTRAKLVP